MTFQTPTPHVGELVTMLSYKRPHGSQTEIEFIQRFLLPYATHIDDFGNIYVQTEDNPRILWSSHTDTVHHEGGRQHIDTSTNLLKLSKPSRGNCLGADCTSGVWLMLEMIRAKRPGLYIFHRGEECGGLGSTHIAKKHPAYLEGIDFAIALDRKGTESVITHQMTRTASDQFAHQLSSLLNTFGHTFAPDDTGVFTDTANYTDLIGECTNLSVGYNMQHGPLETQDLEFLLKLRDTLCTADFSTLTPTRKAGELEDFDDLPWSPSNYKPWVNDNLSDWVTKFDLDKIVNDHPEAVVEFLFSRGYDAQDIKAFAEMEGLDL